MTANLHKAFFDHIEYPANKQCDSGNPSASQKHYRSIIVLNGQIPDLSFFNQDLPIIAADGAANQLVSMGLRPDLVIGDLDSIDPELRHNFEVIHIQDQNYCDFYKTIDYLKLANLLPSIITGIGGGTIDHILQNINVFLNTESIFYAPPVIGYVLQAGISKKFSLPINTKISLFGLPAQISTQGLKWELESCDLSFPGVNSSFNRSLNNEVLITVHSGLCLTIIYLEPVKDAGI